MQFISGILARIGGEKGALQKEVISVYWLRSS
jgi:hypothetical protein